MSYFERSRPRGLFALLLSTSALAGLAVPACASAADATAATPSTSVEELVVTASKRAESIKDTPTAITALTSDKLDSLGVKDFNDYLPYVPSLQMADQGAPGQGIMILRGVYSGYEQTTATVGFYIDDTPFTPTSAGFPSSLVLPDPDLSDVERVEVLKGPQATLYGASTLGGLIRVVTKKPDLDQFSGDIRVDGTAVEGGDEGAGIKASVNMPIVKDQIALRVTGFDRFEPGYVSNVKTGQDDVNGARVYGGKATLRIAPTDRLDIELNGFYQKLHTGGTAAEDLDPTTLQPIEGRYKYASFFNSTNALESDVENLTATYRLDQGTLTNSTSFAHYRDTNSLDYTLFYGPLLGFAGDEALLGVLKPEMKKFTEELRFNSNRIGPLEFQAGFFYTHESDSYGAFLDGVHGSTGAPLPAPLDNIVAATSTDKYDEYAGYADATFHFNDRLDATAGIRQSYNVQSGVSNTTGLLAGPGPYVPVFTHSTDSDTSYLFDIRWRPTDEISTYGRVASAYRPGGPQFSPSALVPSSFGPDTVWNYELGAKGTWFGGLLSADIDAYYIDWNNIQLNALVGGFTVTGNGGKAHSEGVEFEGQLRPVAGFVIGANLAYDKTRIDSISADSTAGALVGDPLPNTPKWSGALTADYSFPLASLTGMIGASYKYHGSANSSFTGLNTDFNAKIPSYSTVDLRTGVSWKQYSLIFRIDNVTNKYALSNISLIQLAPGDPLDPVTGSGVPIQPRTFRVSFEARF